MPNIIRVSVSEAARLFGVSGRTIRRAIADGHVTYVVVRGRYKLSFESLVRWSQERPKVRNKLERAGIGQFVGQWKIRNRLYSPNPRAVKTADQEMELAGQEAGERRPSGNSRNPSPVRTSQKANR